MDKVQLLIRNVLPVGRTLAVGMAALLSLAHAHAAGPAEGAERHFLYESNDPYARKATVRMPHKPVEFFQLIQSARALKRASNCVDAIPLFEAAVGQYADNGDAWGLLGRCRAEVGEWIGAVVAYEQALALGTTPWDTDIDLNPNDMMVAIARAYAEAGNTPAALSWLRRGIGLRFDERPAIAEVEAFARLIDDPEFRSLAGLPAEDLPDREARWERDIVFLGETIAQLHADPDFLLPADERQTMLDDLAGSVSELSDEQIVARIDLIIGKLGGGHDLFWPVETRSGALIPFAVKLYWFDDGLYIIDSAHPELRGSRVLAFGDTPADEASAIVEKAFPGDNALEARWMSARHLSQPYTLEALGIVDDQATATITVVNRSGTSAVVTPEREALFPFSPALTAQPEGEAPLYLSDLGRRFWMRPIPEHDALYLQINRVGDTPAQSFAAFADDVAVAAHRQNVRHLILDLRHSPGGNGYLTPPLLRQLVRFDADPAKGHLFVLIGRNTFSASQNLITDLDRIADPIFVGEPSASRPNAVSESGNFRLPYSEFEGSLSSQLHQHSWPEDHRIWIAPDIPVGLTSKDYFAGRDPAIEAIYAVIDQENQ